MPIERETKFLMNAPANLRTRLNQNGIAAHRLTQCYVPGRAVFSQSEPAVTLIPDDPESAPSLTLALTADDHDIGLSQRGAMTGIPGEIRFRSVEAPDGFTHVVAFKIPIPEGLLELEETVPVEEVEMVRSSAMVRKTRFSLPAENGRWDIDFLHPRHVDDIVIGLIEFEGERLDAIVPHPLLDGHLGARIPKIDEPLFTNRRLSDSAYAAELVQDYMLGVLQREGQAKAVPGITVLHPKYEHSPDLYDAVCGEPDHVLVKAARKTAADGGYRAVGRFSTDSLESALAMTTHGRVVTTENWQTRYEPARYRFYSPLGRTKEASSFEGCLFVHAGEGYVLTDGPRFLPIGPVDVEAVRAAYPWP